MFSSMESSSVGHVCIQLVRTEILDLISVVLTDIRHLNRGVQKLGCRYFPKYRNPRLLLLQGDSLSMPGFDAS